MFLKIDQATYKGNFVFGLHFNNGEYHEVSLKEELFGEIFEPLNDESYISTFSLQFGTLSWQNGADFAPEYLYELAMKTKSTTA